MKRLYLVLAILGAILPYAYFIQHFSQSGFNLAGFIAAATANPAAAGFTADLVIASVTFWAFMFADRRQDPAAPAPALFIALNLLIGLSCALPAWLYARTARKAAP